MDFGSAINAVREGKRIAREGWNGKGMYLLYCNTATFIVTGLNEDGEAASLLPFLVMKTAHGPFIPWLASQADVLADDWSAI